MKENYNLDTIDHIAIQVKNIEKSVAWYKSKFKCKVIYIDKTWAFIEFKNTKLALVTNTEHPPHFAVLNNDVQNNPKAITHRDGSISIYTKDNDNNYIELITYKEQ